MMEQTARESMKARESYKWHDFIPVFGMFNYPFRNWESFEPENNPCNVLARHSALLFYNAALFMIPAILNGGLEKILPR